jgi:hypothetical protein
MGSRANYVVVDDRGWRLYYSHWGAQTVDIQLAPGPEHALRFVTGQQPRDPDSGWLDDRWCEGGAAIDTIRRELTFFGGFEFLHGLEYRRAYFALLEETWSGWAVRWAYDGLADLAKAVGVAPATVRVPELALSRKPVAPVVTRAAEDEVWALLTVRELDGALVAWQLDTHYLSQTAVWFGPGLLDLLPEPGSTLGHPPEWGIHVDPAARRMSWWATAHSPGLQAETPYRWPGWDVRFWRDRYEDHRAVCGDLLSLPDIDYDRGFADLAGRLDVERRQMATALATARSKRP